MKPIVPDKWIDIPIETVERHPLLVKEFDDLFQTILFNPSPLSLLTKEAAQLLAVTHPVVVVRSKNSRNRDIYYCISGIRTLDVLERTHSLGELVRVGMVDYQPNRKKLIEYFLAELFLESIVFSIPDHLPVILEIMDVTKRHDIGHELAPRLFESKSCLARALGKTPTTITRRRNAKGSV